MSKETIAQKFRMFATNRKDDAGSSLAISDLRETMGLDIPAGTTYYEDLQECIIHIADEIEEELRQAKQAGNNAAQNGLKKNPRICDG